jgi:hypothetical protein
VRRACIEQEVAARIRVRDQESVVGDSDDRDSIVEGKQRGVDDVSCVVDPARSRLRSELDPRNETRRTGTPDRRNRTALHLIFARHLDTFAIEHFARCAHSRREHTIGEARIPRHHCRRARASRPRDCPAPPVVDVRVDLDSGSVDGRAPDDTGNEERLSIMRAARIGPTEEIVAITIAGNVHLRLVVECLRPREGTRIEERAIRRYPDTVDDVVRDRCDEVKGAVEDRRRGSKAPTGNGIVLHSEILAGRPNVLDGDSRTTPRNQKASTVELDGWCFLRGERRRCGGIDWRQCGGQAHSLGCIEPPRDEILRARECDRRHRLRRGLELRQYLGIRRGDITGRRYTRNVHATLAPHHYVVRPIEDDARRENAAGAEHDRRNVQQGAVAADAVGPNLSVLAPGREELIRARGNPDFDAADAVDQRRHAVDVSIDIDPSDLETVIPPRHQVMRTVECGRYRQRSQPRIAGNEDSERILQCAVRV